MGERHHWFSVAWLGSGCVAFSLALACAAPFAGLGAAAAVLLGPRSMVAAVLLGWAANQAVGFGLLTYPMDGEGLAWGAALGLSALAAALAARAVVAVAVQPSALRVAGAFVAAFLAQQITVVAAALILPSHPESFALHVVAGLFLTNALGFAVLAGAVVAARGVWPLRRPVART